MLGWMCVFCFIVLHIYLTYFSQFMCYSSPNVGRAHLWPQELACCGFPLQSVEAPHQSSDLFQMSGFSDEIHCGLEVPVTLHWLIGPESDWFHFVFHKKGHFGEKRRRRLWDLIFELQLTSKSKGYCISGSRVVLFKIEGQCCNLSVLG